MKKSLFILTILPTIVYAQDSFYTADPNKAPKGIIIVPAAKISNPKNIMKNISEQKSRGYVYNIHNNAFAMINDNKNPDINNIDDPKDTHMKSDLTKIRLGFNFKPVSSINAIGYAVGGAYIENAGWTSISTFFNDKEIGSCEFGVNSMKLSHGAIRIAQEDVRHDVNNKITTVYVEGAPKLGFIYYVMWNDNDYNYSLQCANTIYDSTITTKMISLAKNIDKEGNGLN